MTAAASRPDLTVPADPAIAGHVPVLWRRDGADTMQISKKLNLHEAVVVELLHRGRDRALTEREVRS